MKLLITGAAGFLGRAVVARALERGHYVIALVRPTTSESRLPAPHPACEIVRLDLRGARGLEEVARGCDVAVHLAAAKTGDLSAQLANTVRATEVLVEALAAAGVFRLVAASSLAVYDYRRVRPWSLIDETSPLEARREDRGVYAETKLYQDELLRRTHAEGRLAVSLLRPGVIYGPGSLWNARLGFPLGAHTWIRVGSFARLPLTYVENCADAFVLAAENPVNDGGVLNVIDNEMPNQRAWVARLLQLPGESRLVVPVPRLFARAVAGCASVANRLLFHGRGRLPDILVGARLEARTRPLRYSNARLRDVLGWRQRFPLDEALLCSVCPPSTSETTPSSSGSRPAESPAR